MRFPSLLSPLAALLLFSTTILATPLTSPNPIAAAAAEALPLAFTPTTSLDKRSEAADFCRRVKSISGEGWSLMLQIRSKWWQYGEFSNDLMHMMTQYGNHINTAIDACWRFNEMVDNAAGKTAAQINGMGCGNWGC